jgi:hypothetical protein
MDATRARRTRDRARQRWYANHRQRRFARHMGFQAGLPPIGDLEPTSTTTYYESPSWDEASYVKSVVGWKC